MRRRKVNTRDKQRAARMATATKATCGALRKLATHDRRNPVDVEFMESLATMVRHRIRWVQERDNHWRSLTDGQRQAARVMFTDGAAATGGDDLTGGAR